MGNQENIPGECVSGFIPVTDTTSKHLDRILKSQRLDGGDLLSVTSLYSVVSKYPAKP